MAASPLSRALFLNSSPALVAFTGSGGKTTCSEALAHEAEAQGRRAVITTTTKIRVPASSVDPATLDDVAAALRGRNGPLYVGTVAADRKKMCGPPLPLLETLPEVADLVVVEADGSRGASVKAYRAEEPVLPQRLDRLCVIVGVDAVGAHRMSGLVHREHLLWPLLGLPDDARLTADDVVAAILRQPSYLEAAQRCSTSILLNKVDDEDGAARARALIDAFAPHLEARGIVRVLIRGRAVEGSVAVAWQRPPRRRVAAVLLAAGGATRFGALKQTADLGGQPLVAASLGALLGAPLEAITVVLGREHAEVEEALRRSTDDPRVRYVLNPAWAEGMSTSIAAGVRACPPADGLLVALGDMPFVEPRTVSQLLDAFATSPFDLVAPAREGRRGHPVLFAARFRGALLGLLGDGGAAPLLARHAADVDLVQVDDAGIHIDVDHPSALQPRTS